MRDLVKHPVENGLDPTPQAFSVGRTTDRRGGSKELDVLMPTRLVDQLVKAVRRVPLREQVLQRDAVIFQQLLERFSEA